MAAIYARVSSEQQPEENTIASQTASLIEFAKGHDLEVPEEWVFEDEGYSGATLERPGLERVRDLAAEGQIQVVLAYSPDRLSRKYAYQILLIEEFARAGAPSRQALCRGWSAVRSVATPFREPRRKRVRASFTTTNALAPIAGGPVCDNGRFVRQELLDQIVWAEVIRLLEEPGLIQQELDRRLAAVRSSDPTT
jgi:hypothetical protein